MLRQGIDFYSYSVAARENLEILSARIKLVPNNRLVKLSGEDYLTEQKFLHRFSEAYSLTPRLPDRPSGYNVLDDRGAVGTGIICRLAREDGCRIYLSGQGADEIMSDYGFDGMTAPGFIHSDLQGYFPADLKSVFPWTNFFDGRQREYLYKDEVVGGAYGIECRYPFLDRRLVQEFLWLRHDLKNWRYKAPLGHYLRKCNFPFAEGFDNKVGFCAGYQPDLVGKKDKRAPHRALKVFAKTLRKAKKAKALQRLFKAGKKAKTARAPR